MYDEICNWDFIFLSLGWTYFQYMLFSYFLILELLNKNTSMLMKYIVPEKEVGQHGKLSRRYGQTLSGFTKSYHAYKCAEGHL